LLIVGNHRGAKFLLVRVVPGIHFCVTQPVLLMHMLFELRAQVKKGIDLSRFLIGLSKSKLVFCYLFSSQPVKMCEWIPTTIHRGNVHIMSSIILGSMACQGDDVLITCDTVMGFDFEEIDMIRRIHDMTCNSNQKLMVLMAALCFRVKDLLSNLTQATSTICGNLSLLIHKRSKDACELRTVIFIGHALATRVSIYHLLGMGDIDTCTYFLGKGLTI